jgi:hypothetical protein
MNDIRSVLAELETELPWVASSSDELKSILANMAFNLGVKGLLKFKKTIGFLALGQYQEASREMLESKWAKQVGKRAERLSKRVGALSTVKEPTLEEKVKLIEEELAYYRRFSFMTKESADHMIERMTQYSLHLRPKNYWG